MPKGQQFLLMNKDVIVLVFSIERDPFSINYITEHIENRSLLPRDLRDLCRWIEGKYLLKTSFKIGEKIIEKMINHQVEMRLVR